MSVLHRIEIPPLTASASLESDLGVWDCCANEKHSFYEPMMQLTLSIDADHTLHLFCEADQIEAAIKMLQSKLSGLH